jgi:hypothetical protein
VGKHSFKECGGIDMWATSDTFFGAGVEGIQIQGRLARVVERYSLDHEGADTFALCPNYI